MRTLVTFAAAVLLAAPALAETIANTNTLAVKDRQFIEKAASGGLAEIKMARLALDKAQSNDVRTFAQRMIDDHSKANDRLKEIAAKNGMMLPTSLDSEDQKIYEKLALTNGREFDKQYMKIMKKDHDKDVKDFETASLSLENASLREFAETTLPTLKEHQQMVETTKLNK
jgi:putative membrane protein